MKKRVLTIIIILMMLSGLSLLLYPTVSSYILSLSYRRVISNYQSGVAALDDDTYERLLAEARAYNERLAAKSLRMVDPTDKELEEYYSMLDPMGSGVMGYVVIPKVNIFLPIYHGVSEGVLQIGVGHLPGSSLPVGGKGTHTILSGHRGLVSSRLFTDIDQLVEGDVFTLRVLNEVLTYQVDQIITALPSEVSQQKIEADQDYCTLLTCTPYGINTHRLLVRGHRIPTPENAVEEIEELLDDGLIFGIPAKLFWLIVAAVILLAAILAAVLVRRWKRNRYQPKRLKEKGSGQSAEITDSAESDENIESAGDIENSEADGER